MQTQPSPKEAPKGFIPEELKATSEQFMKTIRDTLHEGRVRHIVVRDGQGHTRLDIPLTLGVVSAMLAPVWTAIGTVAAMASGFSLVVERPPADGTPQA